MSQYLPTVESGQSSAVEQRRYPPWVWIFAVAVMLATTIPYLLGYAFEGDEWQFTGFVFGVEDGNSYTAKMLRGAHGDWLFRTPYTAQRQQGVLAFLPYLLLGKLTAPPGQHEQLVALFHLFRIGAGMLSILASYDFLTLFIENMRWRVWGVVLCALGGGLGWLLILLGKASWFGSLPLEMYSPETFGFLSLYGLPHLALARALLLWGLRAYLQPGLSVWADRPGLFSGALWLLMGLMQPLAVAVAWAIIGAHCGVLFIRCLWRFRRKEAVDWVGWRAWLRRAARIVGISAPILIYTVWAFNDDPILHQWTAQNLILSPHPLHYLIAYGLLIPFGILGVVHLLRERREVSWLLLAWSLALPFLVYAPYPLQRRLAEGYWIALVALAMVSYDRIERENLRVFRWVLGLAFPSALLLLFGGVNAVRNPGAPIFHPQAEVEAFVFFDEYADSDAVVLASYETGNTLPAWAPVFVLIGHGPESVGLAELTPRVERFYRADTPSEERLGLIAEFGIDYVFWGPHERELGDWDPRQEEFLESVFSNGMITVFAVSYVAPNPLLVVFSVLDIGLAQGFGFCCPPACSEPLR